MLLPLISHDPWVGTGGQGGHLRVPWSGGEGIYLLLQAAVRAGLLI